ncbi:hypothetical protein GCM10012319_71950 [Comamonas sp. KCTC 72670]|nr:hypothetical protein GCM10012319_71950 [Comamonas sp. KCTC 72670]
MRRQPGGAAARARREPGFASAALSPHGWVGAASWTGIQRGARGPEMTEAARMSSPPQGVSAVFHRRVRGVAHASFCGGGDMAAL